MDWHDIKLLGVILGGLLISVLLSASRTWKAALTSASTGAFIAVVFTEPTIQWIGWEVSDYRYAVAGFLAMTGDRMARRAFDLIDKFELPRFGK